jgi:hypothetical protein
MDGHERMLLWVTASYVFLDALRHITDRIVSWWGAI